MEEIKQLLHQDRPVKWLFYGDSITHGALHTFGWRDYTQLFAERLRFELGRSMDIVINSAISGNTTHELLQGFDWRVAQFQPDVLLLMIGMNDCSEQRALNQQAFEQNLHALAEKSLDIGARTVMQTTCPILPGTAPDREPFFDAYMNVVREVAAEYGLPLIDHQRYWAQHPDQHYFWMSNGFHPNEYGHRAFARLLFETLDIYDPDSPTCQLYLP